MKKIKWSSIIIAVCYMVGGVFFLIDSDLTKDLICRLMGYGLLAIGVINVAVYFLRPKQESFLKNEFMNGLLLITVGLLVLLRRNLFIELVYFMLGIVIAISGYRKLQDCVDCYRLGLNNVILYLVLAAISIAFSLIICLDATIPLKALHNLIGAGLLYSGLSDLVSAIFLSSKMNDYIKKIDEIIVEENKQEENPEE